MAATKKTDEEVVEILESEVKVKEVVIGEGSERLVFSQKPLTFFGKIEFFSVAGKAVEKILSDGNTFNDLLGAPESGLLDETEGVDSFAKGIAKIVQFAPEILGDLYCIILNVPRHEREYVKMRLEEELEDEQGFEILQTFVDQNWEVMTNFFNQGIMPLFQKIQTKLSRS